MKDTIEALTSYRAIMVDEVRDNNYFGQASKVVEEVLLDDIEGLSHNWKTKVEEDLSVTFSYSFNVPLPSLDEEIGDTKISELDRLSFQIAAQVMQVGRVLETSLVALSEAGKFQAGLWKAHIKKELVDG